MKGRAARSRGLLSVGRKKNSGIYPTKKRKKFRFLRCVLGEPREVERIAKRIRIIWLEILDGEEERNILQKIFFRKIMGIIFCAKLSTFLTRLIELPSSLLFFFQYPEEARPLDGNFLSWGKMRCVGRRHKNKEQGGTEEGRFLSD